MLRSLTKRSPGVRPEVSSMVPLLPKTDLDGVPHLVCTSSPAAQRHKVDNPCGVEVIVYRHATGVDWSASVLSACPVPAGSIGLANLARTNAVSIGRHVVVVPRVMLAHVDLADDFSLLAAATALGGQVRVGRAVHPKTTHGIRFEVLIGADATVDVGVAVLENVPAGNQSRLEGVS